LKASRGEATSVRVATGERFVLVRLSDSLTETYGSYRVTVLDGTGLSRWTQVVPPAEAGEELEVVIPIADLPDGRHQLELEGVPGAGASPGRPPSRASYAFTLVRGE
jgi:hypothetical protein